MDKAWEEWRRGEYPGHHLWGITHLPGHGIDVDILPFERYPILNKIGQGYRLGNYLDQQIRAYLRSPKYDLVYSACQDNTLFLSILREMGVFRKPIVSIIHHPIEIKKRNKIYVKGHDRLLCLSKSVLRDLEDKFNLSRTKICSIDWGVDLSFYDREKNSTPAESESSFILSAGKSSRDHDTLAKAFVKIGYPLKIYCSARSAPSISGLPSNITVQYDHPVFNAISYLELLAEYRKAFAIAIPLIGTDSLAGLTSLLDAMAMQRAVIMTTNHRINLDIEKEGVGICVAPGDVSGWQRAVNYLLAHPEEANAMGRRGYHLCKTKYNLEVFSSTLACIFKSLQSSL